MLLDLGFQDLAMLVQAGIAATSSARGRRATIPVPQIFTRWVPPPTAGQLRTMLRRAAIFAGFGSSSCQMPRSSYSDGGYVPVMKREDP